MRKKILIVGKRPLPIGGVTIHVDRLVKLIDKLGYDYTFYDFAAKIHTISHLLLGSSGSTLITNGLTTIFMVYNTLLFYGEHDV